MVGFFGNVEKVDCVDMGCQERLMGIMLGGIYE